MSQDKAIHVAWGDTAQTYIRWTFQGDWNAELYFNSVSQVWKLIDTKSAGDKLNLLIDMRLSGKTPSNLSALMRSAIPKKKMECDVEQIIVISNGSFWHDMFKITGRHHKRIADLEVQFVETDNDANRLLNW